MHFDSITLIHFGWVALGIVWPVAFSPQNARCIYPTRPVAEFVRKKLPSLSQTPLRKALGATTAAERAAITNAVHRLRELLEAIGEV